MTVSDVRGGRASATLVLLLGAAAFGALDAVVRGDRHGVRDTVANLGAPWVALALVAGVVATGGLRGALTGLAATGTALVAFYVTVAAVDSGPRTRFDIHVEHVMAANASWFVAGTVSGPVFGAVGAALRRRAGAGGVARSLGRAVGVLLVAEPVAVGTAALVPRLHAHVVWQVDALVYVVELALGAGVLAALQTPGGTVRTERPPADGPSAPARRPAR